MVFFFFFFFLLLGGQEDREEGYQSPTKPPDTAMHTKPLVLSGHHTRPETTPQEATLTHVLPLFQRRVLVSSIGG